MVEIIAINVTASFAAVFFKVNLILPMTPIISNGLIFIDPLRTSFKTEELGFFDPKLPIKYGLGDVVRIGKNTIYRSVYLFVQRIIDIVSIKGDKIVSYNLSLYFRGAALE